MKNHHCPWCGSQFHAVYSRHYRDHGYQQYYQYPYASVYNYVSPQYYPPRTFQLLITPTELKNLAGKQITTTIKDIGQVKACVVNYDETSNRVTLSNIILIQTGDSLGTQAYRPDELIGYNKIADTCPGTGTGTTPGGAGAGTGGTIPEGDTQGTRMKLMLDQTFTYGWSHSGVQSWGANWGIHAVNQAAEQIRTSIAMMVNLQQLEVFTGKDLKSAIDVAGSEGMESSSIKIGWKKDMSTTEQMNWINRNNFLIDVSDVRIVPGTMWSKTETDWQGRRSWKASATMQYRLRIWGRA